MKKMTSNGKLALHRETLATLTSDELSVVNGGNAAITRPIITVSKRYCPAVSRAICPETVSRALGCGGDQPPQQPQAPQAGGE